MFINVQIKTPNSLSSSLIVANNNTFNVLRISFTMIIKSKACEYIAYVTIKAYSQSKQVMQVNYLFYCILVLLCFVQGGPKNNVLRGITIVLIIHCKCSRDSNVHSNLAFLLACKKCVASSG